MDAGREQWSYIESLSELFERIGGWSFDHRWVVLAICLLLLGACAYFASQARFDNSFEAYFDTDDPAYAAYNGFREDFGSDEISYILYEAPGLPHGPFDLGVMRKIASLTEALEEVPFVKEVTSLANVEYVEGVPDGLEIYQLLEEFSGGQQDLLEIREKVLAKPLYVGGLVSREGDYAAIIIDMDRSAVDPLEEIRLDPEGGDALDNLYPQVTYHAIEELLARPEYEGIVFHHVGDVPLNTVYNEISSSESGRLAGITFGVITLLLLGFFRRPIGIAGPLAVVALSVMVSIGLVGLLGWKLDLMFVMLPTLLIAVGVASSVHIIAEFRAYHAELGDRREAVRRTMYLVGTPCLLTSLTTAAGFVSMSIAPIKSISHFAVYSAVGVVAAFLLSVTLLIVFLSFGRRSLPREASEAEKVRAKGGRLFHAALAGLARFDVRHRRAIIAVFAGIFVLSALGIARLRVDSNFLNEFSEDEPIRVATHYVDEIMGGTYSFVYLFDSGAPEGIKSPEFLREIERLQAEADRQSHLVKKTYSIVDLLRDINKSFNEEDPAHYVLPETRELVAQYLLLYEMSGGEDLQDFVSSDFARASLELRCKAVETSVLDEMVDGLDAYLEAQPVSVASISVTGIGAIWLKLQGYITSSQIRGLLLAFSAIAALMCFVFQSLKTGLLAMVPNLSPVVLTLGVMGWIDMPLDYVRLMIATVAIGISVDDTIHHMTRFRHEFLRCGSYEQALEASTVDVGRALVITSVVLVAGFLVFLLSSLDSFATFGALLATTISVALVADFLLMPALVLTWKPWGPGR
ncbi:MAG: RND family transporter [Deltaproteobacteria bacterium]|nr:RND family transporter [Deltaproteobacteria bacterium]